MVRRSTRTKEASDSPSKRPRKSDIVTKAENSITDEKALKSDQNTSGDKIASRLEDWRSDCKEVKKLWLLAQKAGQFCDVRLAVGPKDSVEYINAHRIFLACASPVFEAMFYGELATKDECVSLPGDDPEAFKFLISHVYGQDVFFPSFRSAINTYELAEKYLIPDLQSRASTYASLHMNDSDFWEVINTYFYSNTNFKDACIKYLSKNAQRLLQFNSFLDVPKDVVEMIVKMEYIEIHEISLLKAVTRWFYKNITEKRKRTRELQEFLRYIRFENVSILGFCDFMDEFPDAIDCESNLAIMKHYNDRSKYALPSWCSANSMMRNSSEVFVSSNHFESVTSEDGNDDDDDDDVWDDMEG